MSTATTTAPATGTRPPLAVRAFRLAAVAEAVSWAALLVGMLFKHVVVGDDLGVRLAGPVHGAVFLAYVGTALLVARRARWSFPTLALVLAASIPPLATVLAERWLTRTGRLR